jgi:pyrroloquinoline-quinone synthase
MDKAHKALEKLDELIARRSILEHPFYQAWREGELSREQLAVYAQIYYPHVAAFPGYLQAALRSTTDSHVRAELEDNLADELGVPKAHPELWLDFAEGLGVERSEVAKRAIHPAAEKAVNTFMRLASESTPAALAGLYAYESQQPQVARQKADGLKLLYGIDDPKTLAYFEVHAEADLHHRQGERRALARCLANGTSEAEVLAAAQQALEAYWGLLDGVCAEIGIG